ncbi:MAG: DUF1549 and DUF1553 domain-containing protein [Planctomycetaceae bacterium]
MVTTQCTLLMHCRPPVWLCILIFVSLPLTGGVCGDSPQAHWSFVPVPQQIPPDSAAFAGHRNAIDSFVARRLTQARVVPSPEANPVTLFRRVTLDLIGIPPTPADVDRYLSDPPEGRYERAVERLLASPHYGEKWAVPWLDLCHYADTDGYLTDQLRPVAWRYRDWLVAALNSNQPFDEFTIEQLAGDLLPGATVRQRLATGFLRQTLSNREGGAEPEEFRVKQIIDRTEMVGAIWLGLTVGCARCHDHKYDPLTQREFFELYACLNNADEVNIDAPLPEEYDAFTSSRKDYDQQRQTLIDPLRADIEQLLKRWEVRCLTARDHPGQNHIWDRQWELIGLVWGSGLGEGQLEGQEIMQLPWQHRSPRRRDDLLDYFLRSGAIVDDAQFRELKLGELQERLQKLKDRFPQATRAPVMQASLTRRQSWIHERGDFRDRGAGVSASSPDCLPGWHRPADQDARRSLAEWLVATENPLTARVTVNRMWEQFFGRGIVLTTEDFGLRGTPPSHPELLDWLASEFLRTGWNVKAMHRLIVCSCTYRQSSRHRADLATVDPDNVLLARQNALRISAEAVRDSGLAVSGLLCSTAGGPAVRPFQSERVTMEGFGNHTWKVSPAPDCYRRGLYTFRIRTTPFAQGVTFDAPNPNQICTRRARSNTPLQALTLLNDPAAYEMAQALADRVLQLPEAETTHRIVYAVRLCLARNPTVSEQARLTRFYQTQLAEFDAEREFRPVLDFQFQSSASVREQVAWTSLCSVLMNLHEFITRD